MEATTLLLQERLRAALPASWPAGPQVRKDAGSEQAAWVLGFATY